MWAVYAITAALLWGLEYTITERLLSRVSLPFLLVIELFCGFVFMGIIAISSGAFKAELVSVAESKQTLLLVGIAVVVFNLANSLILLSIESKNATLSGLIEISYPLFVALFSWFLFKESTLNSWTALGAIFILTGVGIIFFLSK